MLHLNDRSHANTNILWSSLKGFLSGVGVMIALAVVLSGISLAFRDPDKVLSLFAYGALAVSMLFCGMSAMLADSERRIAAPIISGTMYVAVLFVFSLLFHDSGDKMPILWRILAYAASILLSLLGGLAVGRRKKRSGNTQNPAALIRKRISSKK